MASLTDDETVCQESFIDVASGHHDETTDESSDNASDFQDGRPLAEQIQIKKLYLDEHGKWVDKAPDIEEKARTGLTLESTIVLRMTVVMGELIPHSLTVQSEILKERLKAVFAGCPGLQAAFRAKELTFYAPFHEFFYRWKKYEEVLRSEDDCTVRAYLQALDDIIRPEIEPSVARHRDILETGVAKFEDVWTVFEAGMNVYSLVFGEDRMYQIEHVNWTALCLQLHVRCIAWDGDKFGWQTESLAIEPYHGYKEVSDLGVVPLELCNHVDSLKERLFARGKRWEAFTGFHYLAYSGAWRPRYESHAQLENGRIIIDSTGYSLYISKPSLTPLSSAQLSGPNMAQYVHNNGISNTMPDLFHPMGFPMPLLSDPAMTKGKNPKEQAPIQMQDRKLNEHHYIFCTPDLHGMCLFSKVWGTFSVDCLVDIRFNDAIFNRLVLPHDYKDLIHAFVESHMDEAQHFDDIIQGKGQGIIFLLCGEPGVGKTLTAEAVAEKTRKPLYKLNADDLEEDDDDGSEPRVETGLQRAFDNCARWGAVLLIDECDSFLEKRASNDLQRNKQVAGGSFLSNGLTQQQVFLRLLEYYQGCVFLTTNRASSFDKAFQSRVDLTIYFPSLSVEARKIVWETFVRPSEDFPHNESNLTDAELDLLTKLDLNGREIKNLVKTGRLLAKNKKEILGLEHVKTVLRVKQMLLTET